MRETKGERRASYRPEGRIRFENRPVITGELGADRPPLARIDFGAEQILHREFRLRKRCARPDEFDRCRRTGVGRGGDLKPVEHKIGPRRIAASGPGTGQRGIGERLELEAGDTGELRADGDAGGVALRCAVDHERAVGQLAEFDFAARFEFHDFQRMGLPGGRERGHQRLFPRREVGECAGGGGSDPCIDFGGTDGQSGLRSVGSEIRQSEVGSDELEGGEGLGGGEVGFAFRVVKEGEEPVIIALRNRIVFVVMALRTLERRAQPDGAGGVDAVEDLVDAALFLVGAGLYVGRRRAVEARGDEWIGIFLWVGLGQEITGELHDGESVEGEVGIHRAHDPIAIGPEIAEIVALKTVGVGVAREIEPRTCPAFAVVG